MNPKASQGFSLIELLVAITLSMILLAGVLQIFLNTKNFFRLETNSSQLHENARFIDLYLGNIIRLAGYRSPPVNAGFPEINAVFNGASAYISGTSDTNINNSDTLTVRYQGSGNGTGTPDGSVRDCLNQPVDSNTIVTNTFSLTNNNELQCQALNPNAAVTNNTQVILSNIEGFEVLYGEDVNGDNAADRYVRANYPFLNWNNVVSIRLMLLLRSEEQVSLHTPNATMNLLGQTFTPAASQYVRQSVNLTLLLRNVAAKS